MAIPFPIFVEFFVKGNEWSSTPDEYLFQKKCPPQPQHEEDWKWGSISFTLHCIFELSLQPVWWVSPHDHPPARPNFYCTSVCRLPFSYFCRAVCYRVSFFRLLPVKNQIIGLCFILSTFLVGFALSAINILTTLYSCEGGSINATAAISKFITGRKVRWKKFSPFNILRFTHTLLWTLKTACAFFNYLC